MNKQGDKRMKLFKQNDRVVDETLGAGVIFAVVYAYSSVKPFGYSVLFDEKPDMRYNCGENPCLVFPDTLTKEISE
jgi:hypothetical protein|tara:strand:+ start:163 stop:390 length:228 start_codon:yes stop_codon:yes gene_type:complete